MDKYTIDQIVDAIMLASDEVIEAIQYMDQDMLKDVLMDFIS